MTNPYMRKTEKKLKFISRITPSRMIFKRFDANVVGMIFRGRLPLVGAGGDWQAARVKAFP